MYICLFIGSHIVRNVLFLSRKVCKKTAYFYFLIYRRLFFIYEFIEITRELHYLESFLCTFFMIKEEFLCEQKKKLKT
jgi:hypothetical protein